MASPTTTPLVAILGPTGSGKSSLAVHLARRFGGEVIACDSAQVYRGFDIGTGKPTDEERGGIAHHMMDVAEPAELFTAGEYRRQAIEILSDLERRGRLPIFTVGTGLYLRALLEGLSETPVRSDSLRERLDASVKTHGTAHLHRILRRWDPAAAARISPNDGQKLTRALEVCLLAGRPMTTVFEAGRKRLEGYTPIKIGLRPPRALLYERIGGRVRSMVARGWRQEVAGQIESGVPTSAKPFEFIGYRELYANLASGGSMDTGETVVKAIAQATRRYAKRQLTWFRKERDVHWVPGFGDDPETEAVVVGILQEALPQPSSVDPRSAGTSNELDR